MVVIFAEIIILVLPGIEEQLASQHFEGHAGKRPHVGAQVVLGACEYLGASVLAGLDFSGEVMMLPAGISQVGDLDLEAFLELGTLV